MENSRDTDDLTRLDALFHFFGWHRDPDNRLSDKQAKLVSISPKMQKYFDKIQQDPDVGELTIGQMAWYVKKEKSHGDGMLKEHPSTADEAFQARIHGAIYGDLVARARNEGRIRNFPLEKEPVYAFFDLGMSDSTSIVLAQFVGIEPRIYDSKEDTGHGIAYYGEYLNRWQKDNGKTIDTLYLPHDGSHRQLSTGKSLAESLRDMNFDVVCVPRTANIWIGINYLREMFPRFWMHKDNLTRKWDDGVRERASFIDCIEAYRMKPEEPGKQSSNEPIHDEYSHMCDALRTMGEALKLGMVNKTKRRNLGRAKASFGKSV